MDPTRKDPYVRRLRPFYFVISILLVIWCASFGLVFFANPEHLITTSNKDILIMAVDAGLLAIVYWFLPKPD